MRIGIQKDLQELKTYLITKGYTVVEEEKHVDVYLYDSNGYEGLLNMFTLDDGQEQGVLMINCHQKEANEIEAMIHQKRYSNLF